MSVPPPPTPLLAPAGLKNCMRVKLDMSAANKALRDPVAFRCNLTHHWRTGHDYKVCGVEWPGGWVQG